MFLSPRRVSQSHPLGQGCPSPHRALGHTPLWLEASPGQEEEQRLLCESSLPLSSRKLTLYSHLECPSFVMTKSVFLFWEVRTRPLAISFGVYSSELKPALKGDLFVMRMKELQ